MDTTKNNFLILISLQANLIGLFGMACLQMMNLKIKPFWGHSTIEQGIEFFHNSGIENMLITHHDPSRTDDQLNVLSKELPKGIIFAKDGMIVDFT